MKFSVGLDSLQWNIKWGWDSSRSLLLGHRIFDELHILWIAGIKGRENSIHLHQMETHAAIKPLCNRISKDFPQLSGLRLLYPSIKFGHEINWKILMYLVLLDWRFKQILSSKSLSLTLYFSSALVIVAKSFEKGFLRSFISKYASPVNAN